MYKGGYQIIDLKDVVLVSGTSKTITGVSSRITNNNRKVFLLCGVTVRGTDDETATALNDEVVNFVESETGYTATLSNGGTIAVTNSDSVTYTQA